MLGRREAHGLEWTAVSPTSTVERRTRGDVHRLHAIHSDGHLAGEVGLDSACQDSTFPAAQRECLDALAGATFGTEKIGVKAAKNITPS